MLLKALGSSVEPWYPVSYWLEALATQSTRYSLMSSISLNGTCVAVCSALLWSKNTHMELTDLFIHNINKKGTINDGMFKS